MTHRDWAREHVLEVLARNWPDAGVIHRAKGIVGLGEAISETDRVSLRYAGVNSAFELDGQVFFPRGGLTTAGTSMRATQQANHVMHAIHRVDQEMTDDPDFLNKKARVVPSFDPERASWRLRVTDAGIGVEDEHSAVFVPLF